MTEGMCRHVRCPVIKQVVFFNKKDHQNITQELGRVEKEGLRRMVRKLILTHTSRVSNFCLNMLLVFS